jgi:hypothetical protein
VEGVARGQTNALAAACVQELKGAVRDDDDNLCTSM